MLIAATDMQIIFQNLHTWHTSLEAAVLPNEFMSEIWCKQPELVKTLDILQQVKFFKTEDQEDFI